MFQRERSPEALLSRPANTLEDQLPCVAPGFVR